MGNVELQIKVGDNWHVLDIDRQTTFGINYKQSDLSNPTATVVPYSNQISLPKTKNNNQVFAHLGIRSTAAIVNPLEKIGFRLYVAGSIFQIGYIKIEEVDIQDSGSYKIRLFGELGNYFGELDKIPLNSLEIDCTHTVNNDVVSDVMQNDNGIYGYALTYQGDYDNFDSNLTDNSSTENSNLIEEATWTGLIKYATTDLNEHKRTEQSYAGEYRSYYQKPTIKFSALFDAIKAKSEELGYEIEPDEEFFNENNPYYNKLWLLSNNYEIGDSGDAYGFISEFGDTTQSSSSDSVHITNNEATELVNGNTSEIRYDRFVSNVANATIDLPVIVSKYIPVKEGATINVKFNVHPIATSYETANYTHYLFKPSPLNTSLRIVDASGNVLAGGNTTPTAATPNNPVPARYFNDLRRYRGNLEIKRPSDKDGFGRGKNFGYDYSTGGNQDDGTIQYRENISWEYEIRLDSVPAGVNGVYVEFLVNGSTWWRTNSNNDDRKYGVAFRVMPGSIIEVNNPDTSEDEQNIDSRKRTGSEVVFSDIISDEHSCFDLLLSYCKLFGLILNIDNTARKIWIGLRENYYSDDEGNYTVLDWTSKVDRSREFKVEPLAFNFRRGVFKYNELGTKYEELYKSKNNAKVVPDYGAFVVDNGYELDNTTYNYLDGTIFDNCIIATDYSSYYSGRGNGYEDNKELPFLQSGDGSRTDVNGLIPLFRDGSENLNIPVRITDDTDVMTNNGVICWNNNSNAAYYTQISSIPKYVRTLQEGEEIYSLNFSTPNTTYSASESLQNAMSGMYQRFWRSYLNDRLDNNCKILVCHVFLSPGDIQGNILSKFIYLDDELWVIDQISSYNPVSTAPTKVRLVKVKDIKNYLDRNNVSDTFKITNGSDVVFDNTTGRLPEVIILTGSETSVSLTIDSTLDWQASSGLTISPTNGEAGETVAMNVTVPSSVQTGSVVFSYGNDTVTVQIVRQTLVTVTATATNGGTATINGNPSPQQIATGRTATFNATASGQFLYWNINGTEYTSNPVTVRITEPTTAVANFLGANQVRLYCDDAYTTITGVAKTDNYWVLNVGQSYTFNNSQTGFSGFLFSSETTFRGTGSKQITADDTYLSVYYNQVLLNLTVINNSPTYDFDGSYIMLGEAAFSFNVDPGTTQQATMNGSPGDITFNRMPYHYPTFSQTSFPNPGVFNLTITGNRVGWDGDKEENIAAGYQEITRPVYGPVSYDLTSNLSISPTSGNGTTNVNITTQGYGGEVVQTIGGFQYTLKLNQDVSELNLGWTTERLLVLEDTVASNVTTYSADFYNSGFPITLGNGLEQTGSGSGYVTLAATFDANLAAERQLIFTVTANGMAYQLIITQEAGGANIGWTQEYLPILQVDVAYSVTNYDNYFYNQGLDYTLSDGLSVLSSSTDAIRVQATFPANDTANSKTLTFFVIVNGTSYQLIITQAGDPSKDPNPIGTIVMWHGSINNIPSGWAICDGTNGTPNLRGYVPRGSTNDATGDFGGSDTATIAINNLPTTRIVTEENGDHTHIYSEWQVGTVTDQQRFSSNNNNDSTVRRTLQTESNGIHAHGFTLNSGTQQPLSTVPAYCTIHFIMKIS